MVLARHAGYIDWRAVTTTLCQSRLYPPVRVYEFCYWPQGLFHFNQCTEFPPHTGFQLMSFRSGYRDSNLMSSYPYASPSVSAEAEFMNVQFHCGFLRILRLDVSVRIFLTIGNTAWFSFRFSSFLLYRNCKKLREFEEREISRQCWGSDCE